MVPRYWQLSLHEAPGRLHESATEAPAALNWQLWPPTPKRVKVPDEVAVVPLQLNGAVGFEPKPLNCMEEEPGVKLASKPLTLQPPPQAKWPMWGKMVEHPVCGIGVVQVLFTRYQEEPTVQFGGVQI